MARTGNCEQRGPVIRGSTTISELMRMHPDGRALALMARLGWPCGQCSARHREALSLAAKRHGNPVRPTIECFRALSQGGPSPVQVDAALARGRRSPDPVASWLQSATRARRLTKEGAKRG